jgi:SAM-dependent methyltransferase
MAPGRGGVADEIFSDLAFARLYDAFNPWGPGDDFYLALAGKLGGGVLDLGCGTGMLACRIAQEVTPVVGVDPAEGMLRIARGRPGAERVKWLEGDARTLDLEQRFSLIYLTGHAFQVFLTDEDCLAMLKAASHHLAPGGRLAFDTRNPAAKAWLSWTPEASRDIAEIAGLERVEESVDTALDEASGIASITHRYRFLDKGTEQTGHSRIRFIDVDHVVRLLDEAGLALEHSHGWWDGTPYSQQSEEIIVVAAAS